MLTPLLFDSGIDRITRVGAYCDSRVSAAVTVNVLAAIGYEAAPFSGAWSEWGSNPTRAVGYGPE